jgi:hypothetical protein
MKKDQNTSPEIQENIIWKRTKIVLKFWWRHFLVIPIIPILLIAIFKMDITAIFASLLAMGFFNVFDNLKCNYKKMTTDNTYTRPKFEEYKTLQQMYPGNSLLAGTPAYISRIGEH